MILAAYDLPMEETVLHLRDPQTPAAIRDWSRAGKVPVLKDSDLIIWDSLAICEYLAEKHPDLPLWPDDPAERAIARAITSEMHSGFQTLRSLMPMNMNRMKHPIPISDDLQDNLDRLDEIFSAAKGIYLMGDDFGIVDAFFCPVASRLHTYQCPLPSDAANTYLKNLRAHQAYQRWVSEAAQEPWVIEDYEKASGDA